MIEIEITSSSKYICQIRNKLFNYLQNHSQPLSKEKQTNLNSR